MNDTTRDELIERIAELADQFACGAAGEPVVYALHGPMDFAEEVIELVTAARDAEIREVLVQPEVVRAAAEATDSGRPDAYEMNQMRTALQAALAAIGLGDGTGGQG